MAFIIHLLLLHPRVTIMVIILAKWYGRRCILRHVAHSATQADAHTHTHTLYEQTV